MGQITHYELCKLFAERLIKKAKIVLYEYQSFSTNEFPDILQFRNGYTWLYEIKMNRQDFLKDEKKECRRQTKIKYFPALTKNHLKRISGIDWEKYWEPELREFLQEYPHLGRERYYVCPTGIIDPIEVRNGWGLYWYNGSRFKRIKDSKQFKANIYDEMKIIEHAFRKYASGYTNNILVNNYKV